MHLYNIRKEKKQDITKELLEEAIETASGEKP